MSRNILKTIKLLVYCTVTIINNCVIEAKFSFPLPPPLSWESGLSVLFKGSAAVSPQHFWLAKPSQSSPVIGLKSCIKTLKHCVFLAQFDYYYCRVTFQHGANIILRNWSQINNNKHLNINECLSFNAGQDFSLFEPRSNLEYYVEIVKIGEMSIGDVRQMLGDREMLNKLTNMRLRAFGQHNSEIPQKITHELVVADVLRSLDTRF